LDTPLAIFAGRSNIALSRAIAESYGTKLGEVTIKSFSDGELYAKYEQSIRGEDVFLIQSTPPPGDNIIELLLLLDAAKRASVKRVTAVIPYFGYARQDRKDQPRVSIAAKLMANLLVEAGADRILTMDLHASQIQGFFDIPLDHLYASRAFIDHYKKEDPIDNLVVVAPDVGSIKMARSYSKRIGASLAFIDKRRPKQNVAEVMNIIGEVRGKNILIIDDLICFFFFESICDFNITMTTLSCNSLFEKECGFGYVFWFDYVFFVIVVFNSFKYFWFVLVTHVSLFNDV
jgi:ribose-phosphate pyrophosphokinase